MKDHDELSVIRNKGRCMLLKHLDLRDYHPLF
jgi:hypothetical protein